MGDQILERTFPRTEYFWYQTDTRIDQFDFVDFPLYTGDFLYIYAGYFGTFEHILTVTRVDETGRAFTTTNIRRENDEYYIEELLLYDPNKPDQGLFYYWTDLANINLGITGFGGFSLWRAITLVPEISAQEQHLAAALNQVLADAGGVWNILIKEVGGDTIYARQTNVHIQTASVTYVPLAMLFFQVLEQRGVDISMQFLESYGTNGRSYAQLLEALLVKSDHEAAQILEDWVSRWGFAPDEFASWGFPSTLLTPGQSTLVEIVELFEGLFTGELIGQPGREIILDYLAEYTSYDATLLGTLRAFLPIGSGFYNDRGPLADDRLIVADVAIIEIGEQVYVLAFFAEPSETAPATYEDLGAAIAQAAKAFWNIFGQN